MAKSNFHRLWDAARKKETEEFIEGRKEGVAVSSAVRPQDIAN